MTVTIAIETPLQDDVRQLVAELNAYLNPLSPPEFQFQMTVEQMADPATTVFVARDDSGRALGMGALKVETPELAEVKRMYAAGRSRAASWIAAARGDHRIGAREGHCAPDAGDRRSVRF